MAPTSLLLPPRNHVAEGMRSSPHQSQQTLRNKGPSHNTSPRLTSIMQPSSLHLQALFIWCCFCRLAPGQTIQWSMPSIVSRAARCVAGSLSDGCLCAGAGTLPGTDPDRALAEPMSPTAFQSPTQPGFDQASTNGHQAPESGVHAPSGLQNGLHPTANGHHPPAASAAEVEQGVDGLDSPTAAEILQQGVAADGVQERPESPPIPTLPPNLSTPAMSAADTEEATPRSILQQPSPLAWQPPAPKADAGDARDNVWIKCAPFCPSHYQGSPHRSITLCRPVQVACIA